MLNEKELEMVLRHERSHIENYDVQWNFFALLTRSTLFFSPSSYYLYKSLQLEMEMECDRRTLLSGSFTIREYGALLLKVAESFVSPKPQTIYSSMTNTNLKRRILSMKNQTQVKLKSYSMLILFAIFSGVSALAFAAYAAKLPGKYDIKASILIDGKVVSNPRIVTIEGESATIEIGQGSKENGNFIHLDLVAREAHQPTEGRIHLDLEFKYIAQGQTVHARPQMMVNAVVKISSDSSESTVELLLNTTRI